MQETKIVFSKEELDLLNNVSVWEYKRTLTEKLYTLLGNCSDALKKGHETTFRKLWGIDENINSKISKGENYRGRPYIILDYPNLFNRESILAVRSMFWFGEMLSSSFIISGEVLLKHEQKLLASLQKHKTEGLYFCLSKDPWQHHFEEDNMVKLEALSQLQIESHVKENGFIKIACKTDTATPTDWESFIIKAYTIYLALIA